MSTKPYVIVVGTDYSENALRALGVAYQYALQHSPAELHVAHVTSVVSPEPMLSIASFVGLPTVPPLSLGAQQDVLTKYLNEQLAALPALGTSRMRVLGHVLVDTPAFGMTRLAGELGADLLVIGSHGLHGVARWLLGSVAEGIVRHAECPVLVVPPVSAKLAVPAIEPPCPRCVAARRASTGDELWCEQHRERHDRRHTYYQSDRGAAETNLPLVLR